MPRLDSNLAILSLGCRLVAPNSGRQSWVHADAPRVIFPLLTPLRVKYAQAVRSAEPYDEIVAERPMMRKDTVALVDQAPENRRALCNRSEGSAPLTVRALRDQLTSDEYSPRSSVNPIAYERVENRRNAWLRKARKCTVPTFCG